MNQRGFSLVLILFIGLGLLLLLLVPIPWEGQSVGNALRQQLFPVVTPMPSKTPEIVISDRSSWKTYTSETFGFSVEYPPDMVIEESRDLVWIRNGNQRGHLNDGVLVQFTKDDLEAGMNLETTVNRALQALSSDPDNWKLNKYPVETVIDSKRAIVYTSTGYETATYTLVEINSKSFLSIVEFVVDPQQRNYQKLADEVVSTVKIL